MAKQNFVKDQSNKPAKASGSFLRAKTKRIVVTIVCLIIISLYFLTTEGKIHLNLSTSTGDAVAVQPVTSFEFSSKLPAILAMKSMPVDFHNKTVLGKFHTVYFCRIGKTGSSTFDNILERFAWNNQLRFATYSEIRGKDWVFSNLVPSFKVGISKPYNFFSRHVSFKPHVMSKFMARPAFNLTFLRHPLSWLESLLNYQIKRKIKCYIAMDLPRNNKAENFVKLLSNSTWMIRNSDCLKKIKNHQTMYLFRNEENIKAVESLGSVKDILFVGIFEYYQESLVLMRRLLGWSFKDMLYLVRNVGKYTKSTDLDTQIYRQFCNWTSDCMLYEYYNRSFWLMVKQQDSSFNEEVKSFKSFITQTAQFCATVPERPWGTLQSTGTNYKSMTFLFSTSKYKKMFVVETVDCWLMDMSDAIFYELLYYRQNPGAQCQSEKCVLDKCTMNTHVEACQILLSIKKNKQSNKFKKLNQKSIMDKSNSSSQDMSSFF